MAAETVASEAGKDRVVRFLDWWLSELTSFLPHRRVSPERRAKRIIEIELRDGAEIAIVKSRGREKTAREERLGEVPPATIGLEAAPVAGPALRLSRAQTLSRTLTLPRAAERRLSDILLHQFSSLMPYPASDAYFDHRIAARSGETIEVELICVARSRLDHWRGALAAIGLAPSAVTVADAPGVDLLRELHAKRRAVGAPRRRILALAALALVVAAVWTPYQARMSQNEALRAELERYRQGAERASAIAGDIERIEARRSALEETLRGGTPRLAVIDAAARALPDGAWLTRLEIEEGRALFYGEAASAAPLIGALEASPVFADAAFLSPVTRSRGGAGERFEIGAKIEPGAFSGIEALEAWEQ